MGAKSAIQKYKHKIPICVYRKPEDMLVIQKYIKTLVPDYKFYVRHYSSFDTETVLYAIGEES